MPHTHTMGPSRSAAHSMTQPRWRRAQLQAGHTCTGVHRTVAGSSRAALFLARVSRSNGRNSRTLRARSCNRRIRCCLGGRTTFACSAQGGRTTSTASAGTVQALDTAARAATTISWSSTRRIQSLSQEHGMAGSGSAQCWHLLRTSSSKSQSALSTASSSRGRSRARAGQCSCTAGATAARHLVGTRRAPQVAVYRPAVARRQQPFVRTG